MKHAPTVSVKHVKAPSIVGELQKLADCCDGRSHFREIFFWMHERFDGPRIPVHGMKCTEGKLAQKFYSGRHGTSASSAPECAFGQILETLVFTSSFQALF
jgi:hypothetical protein